MTTREQLEECKRIGRKYYEPPYEELMTLAERLLDAIEEVMKLSRDGVPRSVWAEILERALDYEEKRDE